MKREFSSQRREVLLFLIKHQYGRPDVTWKQAILSMAKMTKNKALLALAPSKRTISGRVLVNT